MKTFLCLAALAAACVAAVAETPQYQPAVTNNFVSNDAGKGTLNVYGTSIEIGFGLAPSTQAYPYGVATGHKWAINNFAVSGAACPDLSGYTGFWSNAVTNATKTLFATIHNDEGIFQIKPYRVDHVRGCRMAAMAWLGTPASQIYTGQNAAWSYSGSWANLPGTPMATVGRYTTSVGATASISLYGKVFYVVTLRQFNNTSTMSVSVDGVAQTDPLTSSTNYIQGIDILTANGGGFAPYLIRVEAPDQGTHTISVNCTAVTGGYCSVLWAQGVGNLSSNSSKGPLIWDVSPIRWGASQRSCTTNTSLCHNDQVTDVYYEEWLQEISVLAGDGINVQGVDVTNPAVYDPDDATCGTQSDGIHPNACGAARIAALVTQEITAAASPRDKAFTKIPGLAAYAGGLFAGGAPVAVNGAYTGANTGWVLKHSLGSANGPQAGAFYCGTDGALCVQRLGQFEYGLGMGVNGFAVLRLGDTTSSFPALCVSGGSPPKFFACDGSQSAAGPYTGTSDFAVHNLFLSGPTAPSGSNHFALQLNSAGGVDAMSTPALLASNNLSDVVSPGTSRANLQIKTQRFALTATSSSAGATADTAATWTVAFSDANYTVSCTDNANGTGNSTASLDVFNKTAAGFSIRLANVTAAANGGLAECIGIHD